MNKRYDKILLVVGVLALLSGLMFYFLNFNKDSLRHVRTDQSGSNQYQAIPVPVFVEASVLWPNPVEQASGELYDVFTPPAIYVNKGGTFIFESPIGDLLPEPFGVYLAQLERKPYRIQFEGYIEEDLNDASKSLLLFYNQEKQQRVRARVNDVVDKFEFTVLKFTIERIRDAAGNIKKLPLVTLRDHRDAQKLHLAHGECFYKKNATVTLRSREDLAFEIEITEEPPIVFKTSLAKYILDKVNLEESSVTVRKLNKNGSDSEIKQLYPVSTNEAVPLLDPIESELNTERQAFEFLF